MNSKTGKVVDSEIRQNCSSQLMISQQDLENCSLWRPRYTQRDSPCIKINEYLSLFTLKNIPVIEHKQESITPWTNLTSLIDVDLAIDLDIDIYL